MTKILGIDPGYERLGIAVLEKSSNQKEEIIFSECFKTSAKLEFPERLILIGKEIKKIIKKYKPDVLAIETLFLTTNQKTVMRVAETRGVIIYEAMQANLEIFEATPLQIKVATTGYGKASKADMVKMVKMLTGVNKSSDDEMDAIGITLTALAHLHPYLS